MNYRKPKNVAKNFNSYYDTIDGKEKELLPNASFSEAIRLTQDNGKSIFLLHSHQADWFNYTFWKFSRFLVRVLWRPLQIHGIKDPTSPVQNFKGLIRVERRLEKWIRNNNNQMIITGYTHRPRFPSKNELPHFNDGSCVHPRCITGLEIENNKITLVKWYVITNEDGTMQITSTILEGPIKITNYIYLITFY